MFSDFQCPFCAKFATATWPKLKQQYVDTGKAQAVFHYLPLTKIHEAAFHAAEAAECARQQGQFRQMHALLFAEPKRLDEESLLGRADKIQLDSKQFRGCLASAATTRIQDDVALATRLGVTGTPTFLVGDVQQDGTVRVSDRFGGAVSLDRFEAAIKLIDTVRPQ